MALQEIDPVDDGWVRIEPELDGSLRVRNGQVLVGQALEAGDARLIVSPPTRTEPQAVDLPVQAACQVAGLYDRGPRATRGLLCAVIAVAAKSFAKVLGPRARNELRLCGYLAIL